MKFHNDASMVGFIGTYKSVDDVIAADSKELKEIGGSFDAIADRLKQVLDFINKDPWKEYDKIKFDDQITIDWVGHTKGPQFCPYGGCKTNAWSEIIVIENSKTQKRLTINKGVEHLVREHHLLEKGNEYGITAKEFYTHFMPEKTN